MSDEPPVVRPQQDLMDAAIERRARILDYITRDPPLCIKDITQMEGVNDRTTRDIIKELEEAHGITYTGLFTRPLRDAMPFGLTTATLRLRQKLGDNVYLINQRGRDSAKLNRHRASARIGLNNREQIRAEERPFNHDWKLSQIERLARELNRDPVEFLLSCLTS